MAEGSSRVHSAIFLSPRTSELRQSVISYGSDQVDGAVSDKAGRPLPHTAGVGWRFLESSEELNESVFNVPLMGFLHLCANVACGEHQFPTRHSHPLSRDLDPLAIANARARLFIRSLWARLSICKGSRLSSLNRPCALWGDVGSRCRRIEGQLERVWETEGLVYFLHCPQECGVCRGEGVPQRAVL